VVGGVGNYLWTRRRTSGRRCNMADSATRCWSGWSAWLALLQDDAQVQQSRRQVFHRILQLSMGREWQSLQSTVMHCHSQMAHGRWQVPRAQEASQAERLFRPTVHRLEPYRRRQCRYGNESSLSGRWQPTASNHRRHWGTWKLGSPTSVTQTAPCWSASEGLGFQPEISG
jgi:hypothetical protein